MDKAGYNEVVTGAVEHTRSEFFDTKWIVSDVSGDGPEMWISSGEFAEAHFCSTCFCDSGNSITGTAESMFDSHHASILNSCTHDVLVISQESDSAEETDKLLTALMQSQFLPSSSDIRHFGSLESLLSSVNQDIDSCYSEKFMGGDNFNAYEPIRLLRPPYPCAPPKIFTR
jgi:hypothetical protein